MANRWKGESGKKWGRSEYDRQKKEGEHRTRIWTI